MHRSYHHGNLREALVSQGVKLIEEKGVNALTLREIGDRVGVSRTAAYRHFADKLELLAAIREAAFTAFADCLEAARNGAPPNSFARLDAMGQAYLRFASEHRAYYGVMFGLGCDVGQFDLTDSDAGSRAFGVLTGTIGEGQAAGEIRPGDPVLLATVVWALTHGLATLPPLEAGASADPFLAAVSGLLRQGLAAPTDMMTR